MTASSLLDAVFGSEHPENLYYGHAGILRRHAGAPFPCRVPGVIQHGWVGDHPGIYGDLSRHGEEDRSRTYLVWGRRNLDRCRGLGYRNAVAIGAPFLYLGPPPAGALHPRGLLLVPTHSCEWARFEDAAGSYRGYLDGIDRIRGGFDPVAASIYWYDRRDAGLVRLFEERGIRVVCFGHRNDPSFLRRFRSVVEEYAYMSSNAFASALFYSLYLRRRAFVYGPQFRYMNPDPSSRGRQPVQEQFSKIYPGLLWESFDGEAHPEIARHELGEEFVKSPRELRRLLGWTPARILEASYARLLPRCRHRHLFFREAECRGMMGARAGMGDADFLGARRDGDGITLLFLPKGRMRRGVRIFVHAYPAEAGVLPPERRVHGFFNLDHDPVVPAERWRRGRVYADTVRIACLPPGGYRIEAGLFIPGGAALGAADAGRLEVPAAGAGNGGAR